MLPYRLRNPFLRILTKTVWDYPVPLNLNNWWNFGSLLGFCLVVQIFSGLLLSMHFVPQDSMAFNSVIHIVRDVQEGWLLRSIHMNFASGFFFCLFIHVGRGIYYGSFDFFWVWFSGVILFFLSCSEGFFGYVLPWGQMSYWGATVITNLLTVFPYGDKMAMWIWGGWSVGNPTLQRFFVFHFLLPFVMSGIIMVHIYYLHKEDSNCPLGGLGNIGLVPFHPYYTYKDLTGVLVFSTLMSIVIFFYPNIFLAKENWTKADPMKTPIDIKPEWYFLFAYAILRSIPHKTGGIVVMAGSMLILFIIPFLNWGDMRSGAFYPPFQFLFSCFIVVFLMLSATGHAHIRPMFTLLGQVLTALYFLLIFLMPLSQRVWDLVLDPSYIRIKPVLIRGEPRGYMRVTAKKFFYLGSGLMLKWPGQGYYFVGRGNVHSRLILNSSLSCPKQVWAVKYFFFWTELGMVWSSSGGGKDSELFLFDLKEFEENG